MAGKPQGDYAAIQRALYKLALGGRRTERRTRYARGADGSRIAIEDMDIIRDTPPNMRAIELILRAYDDGAHPTDDQGRGVVGAIDGVDVVALPPPSRGE